LGLFGKIGFGIRRRSRIFSGRVGGLEALEFFQRFIKGSFDARLVAKEVFDGARVLGVLAEDKSQALFFGQAGVLALEFGAEVAEAEVEQAGLDAAQAGEAPGGHDHLLDEEIFGGSGGVMLGFEGFEQFAELLVIFGGKDGGLGGEAMAEGIEANGGAAFGCARAGAQLSVAAVGVDLLLGRHGCCSMVAGDFSGGSRFRQAGDRRHGPRRNCLIGCESVD